MPELEDNNEEVNLNETLARLFAFLLKRRWVILLPFFGVTLAASVVLARLPNRYTSTATLLVVQQQVPQRYVVPNSTTDVTSALQAMKQEVLSRAQLLRMINDFGLYSKEKKRLAPEQLVDLMNSNIDIVPMVDAVQRPNKDVDSFRISFTTENAITAQRVTDNLTSLFITEYNRTGTEQSINITGFLHQQVQEKGKELEAQEGRLRDFKLQHVGELPEQQTGNLGILTGLNNQLQNAMTSLDRAQRERALMQAQLQATPRTRILPNGPSPVATPENQTAPVNTLLEAAQSDLARLQAERQSLLRKKYTSVHPDVQSNQRAIAEAQNRVNSLKAAAPAVKGQPRATTTPSPLDPPEDPAVALLKANLEGNRVEIENLTKDEARLRAQVAQYEGRINQMPVREQQEQAILRDTEVLRAQYSELQKKEQESQLATNLEKQQGGQQFRLVDPASLPSLPSSPKRMKLSMGAAAGGIFLGLALAFFMQMRDTSYYSESDLTKHLAPPFVLGIPALSTGREETGRRWRNLFQWIGATAMLLVVGIAELYVYRLG